MEKIEESADENIEEELLVQEKKMLPPDIKEGWI